MCSHIVSKTCPFVLPAHLLNRNTVLRQCNTLGMIGDVCLLWRWSEEACARGQFVLFQMSGWVIRTRADRRRPGSRVNCHTLHPSPVCAPTVGILERARLDTLPHLVSYSGVQVPPGEQEGEKSLSNMSCGWFHLVLTSSLNTASVYIYTGYTYTYT